MQIWGSHRAQQEREFLGYTWLRGDIPVTVLGATLVALFTVQQQPDLGRAFTQNGVQGPNIRPVSPVIMVAQEQPYHPRPITDSAFPTASVTVFVGTARRITTRQEEPQDRVGYVWLRPSIQGPNVKWAGDTLIVKQELPDYKAPMFLSGQVLTGNFKTLARDYIFTTQQIPDHSYPKTFSATPANVGAPVTNYILTLREQPNHPTPYTWRGLYGPGARPPITDTAILRQQLPDHPAPFFEGRVRLGVNPPIRRTVFQFQETESVYNHPRPFTRWFQQPLQIPPITFGRHILLVQEQPRHPVPTFFGLPIPNNSPPPLPSAQPQHQENLTFDMLASDTQPSFYTDPGLNQQVLTEINYPLQQFAPIGWMPLGGFAFPIGNMYNRDLVLDPTGISDWSTSANLIGGWKTAIENLTDDQLSLQNQTGFFIEPLEYQINALPQQYYPLGLQVVGMDAVVVGRLGVKPYG